MPEVGADRSQFESDVAALKDITRRYAAAFDKFLAVQMLLSSDDDASVDELVHRSELACGEGDKADLLASDYMRGLTTPETNGRLYFKHLTFYSNVRRGLRRITDSFFVYRAAFRLFAESDDSDALDLVGRAWEAMSDSHFVEVNFMFLKDLSATGDHIADISVLDKSLEMRMENVRALGKEILAALGLPATI